MSRSIIETFSRVMLSQEQQPGTAWAILEAVAKDASPVKKDESNAVRLI